MKALVLSGGAAKGSYQVGALKKWILEDGNDYDVFIGTSIGNLNGGFLAQAHAGELPAWLEKLEKLWLEIDTPDVYRKWCFGELAALWKWSGGPRWDGAGRRHQGQDVRLSILPGVLRAGRGRR
jgi:predicted acylesterase/phospholipase RssA